MFLSKPHTTFLLSIALMLPACASELPGIKAQEITATTENLDSLQISLAELEELNSDEYRAYQVSFKNETDRWQRFETIQLSFPGQDPQPEILLGSDLNSYLASIDRRNKIDGHNKQLAYGSLYALGLIAGVTGAVTDNASLAVGGAALSIGSMTAASVETVLATKDRAQFQAALPESHLLKPFDLAPKLSLTRWIIVRMPANQKFEDARISVKETSQSQRMFQVVENKPVRKKAGQSSFPQIK